MPHRTNWNLRYSGFPGGRRGGGRGPLVAPGTYSTQAFKRVNGKVTKLGEEGSFEVVSIVEPSLESEDRAATLEFLMEVAKFRNVINATSQTLAKAIEELEASREAIAGSPKGTNELMEQARELEIAMKDARVELNGDPVKIERFESTVPSVGNRVGSALYGSFGNTHGVTKTQREQVEIAREEFTILSVKIRNLVEKDLPEFEKRLNEAGIPWTPGRAIPDLGD